jgi:hypothetical protein
MPEFLYGIEPRPKTSELRIVIGGMRLVVGIPV